MSLKENGTDAMGVDGPCAADGLGIDATTLWTWALEKKPAQAGARDGLGKAGSGGTGD
jgi:hypothetical protein